MSEGKLSGKVAIVSGASRGIGAAIARRLASDGAAVVVNYVNSEKHAFDVAESITSVGGRALPIRADFAEPAQIRAMVERACNEFGRIDILVNNGAVCKPRMIVDFDLEHYDETFNVNVRGIFVAIQEVVRRFGEGGGRIINISSGAVSRMMPAISVYTASKAALEGLTRSLAGELGERGITVNTIAAGAVDTDMFREAVPKEVAAAMIQGTALRRLGTPPDIADVVAFFASNDARWITGRVLEVSGGLP